MYFTVKKECPKSIIDKIIKFKVNDEKYVYDYKKIIN